MSSPTRTVDFQNESTAPVPKKRLSSTGTFPNPPRALYSLTAFNPMNCGGSLKFVKSLVTGYMMGLISRGSFGI